MIRGIKKPLPSRGGKANLTASIHNRFDIEVVDAKTGEVKQRAQALNVICDQLWTRMLTPAAYFNCIHYGTGTGTPSAADTSLFSFYGYGKPVETDDVWDYTHDAECYTSLTRKIQLSETTAVGQTLTEVGIGYSTDASSLCTHAMLQDMNGNQISITKTDTDVINIYATIFGYWPEDLKDSMIGAIRSYAGNGGRLWRFVFGLESSLTADRYLLSDSNFVAYRANAYYPDGSLNFEASVSTTYNASSKTVDLVFTRAGVGDANIGGLKAFHLMENVHTYTQSISTYKLGRPAFSIYFPYDNVKKSRVTNEAVGTGDGITCDFSTQFSDVSNATIYVDGVAADGVTVDTGLPPQTTYMDRLFKQINRGDGFPQTYYAFGDGTIKNQPAGTVIYLENPYCEFGLDSVYVQYAELYASDDLVNWSDNLFSGSSGETISIPEEHQHKRYWKIVTLIDDGGYARRFTSPASTGVNIHFTTPPAEGAVITASYDTEVVAKDENHVFDLTVTLQLGEYTE